MQDHNVVLSQNSEQKYFSYLLFKLEQANYMWLIKGDDFTKILSLIQQCLFQWCTEVLYCLVVEHALVDYCAYFVSFNQSPPGVCRAQFCSTWHFFSDEDCNELTSWYNSNSDLYEQYGIRFPGKFDLKSHLQMVERQQLLALAKSIVAISFPW